MAYKKKIHSPIWWDGRNIDEDLCSPQLRGLLKFNMEYIGADYDSQGKDVENIEIYRERWNVCMGDANWADKLNDITISDMLDMTEFKMNKTWTMIDSILNANPEDAENIYRYVAYRAKHKKDVEEGERVKLKHANKLSVFKNVKKKKVLNF
jgi:DNA polymerase III delta prime subunit